MSAPSSTQAAAAQSTPAELTRAAATVDPREGPRVSNAVFVNVYDVTGMNSWLWNVGFGVHHAGIEVYDKEYQYGRCEEGTGVDTVEPRHSPPHVFREQFFVGLTSLSPPAVEQLVSRFRESETWRGSSYHLIKHNCIDFARALCAALMPPELRVAQLRAALPGVYNSPYMETVVVEGTEYSVPVLIPPHVDRLCQYALAYLPESALVKLDSMDNPFPAS